RGWAPLHYVCHSCFASVPLARELLERGANPNAYFANEHGPMSVLYGAAGVLHDPELTRLLLEAGADPNTEPRLGDALYHSVDAAGALQDRLPERRPARAGRPRVGARGARRVDRALARGACRRRRRPRRAAAGAAAGRAEPGRAGGADPRRARRPARPRRRPR